VPPIDLPVEAPGGILSSRRRGAFGECALAVSVLAALAVAAWALPARAQNVPPCMALQDMAAVLLAQYGETPRALGAVPLAGDVQGVLLFLNDETRTFTITATEAGGRTCVKIAGLNWEWKVREPDGVPG
jgi:hypothetical protein